MISVAERYTYPGVIDDVIGSFVTICHKYFSNGKLGILLAGSASRGELSWSNECGKLVFYSDIEFMVVVDKKYIRLGRDFNREIEELNRELNLGERFKIDFVVNTWKSIKKVEKRFLIFDSKNTGIDLGDVEVRPFLPDVNRENLNFRELNDVLLHRMKAMLADVPSEIFFSKENLNNFRLAIAKNTLDITTWLHPYESKDLVSGFENRINDWEQSYRDLILSKYFGELEFNFLRNCIALRKSVLMDIDVAEMMRSYISIYEKAMAYCKTMNNIDSQRSLNTADVSKALFWEYSPRRRMKEAYLIAKNQRIFGLKMLLRHAFMPRKGLQVEFCFSMLKALSYFLSEESKLFEKELKKSSDYLGVIILFESRHVDMPIDRWLVMRKKYSKISEVII